ncbi:segregation/condensation protein A [Irregularibacter muris]|uniref:Segregation and condensation protein A n=1 Tax=Irregularibacter muris TaxID=1796619 RepID=A0AAE3HEP9_9FIRM|nr:segregation/condensation protein A [Irregularibacter muris]MCR1898044.1 segregation/condensation protein A [Irregularibacter muris]
MSYKIVLNSFQGPLDLLLHLIEKNKVDIYDIPIAEITFQYMQYINQWKSIDLEIASEFLIMAATLLEIKSKMLLPDNDEVEEQLMIEEVDPRQELMRRLIEYKKFKQLSLYLKEREKSEIKVIYKDPEYYPELEIRKPDVDLDMDVLFKTFQRLLIKKNMLSRAKEDFHQIKREVFTIEEKTKDILKYLEQDGQSLNFNTLLEQCESRNELITMFLAVLELMKMRIIVVKQQELFDEILIIKKDGK